MGSRSLIDDLDNRTARPGVTRVRLFGARGDGTTNDLAAFREAIEATPEGGTLIIDRPESFYRLYEAGAGPLLEIHKSMRLVGEGASALKSSHDIASALEVRDDSGTISTTQTIIEVDGSGAASNIEVHLRNIYLTGGKKGVTWGAVTHQSTIDNVILNVVGNPSDPDSRGFEVTGNMIGCVMRRLHVTGNGNSAIGLSIPDATDVVQTRWVDCRLANCGTGVRIVATIANTLELGFDNLTCESNLGAGLDVQGGVRANIRQPHFENNGRDDGTPDIIAKGFTSAVPCNVMLFGGHFSVPNANQSLKRIRFDGAQTVVTLIGTRINGSYIVDGQNFNTSSRFRCLFVPNVPTVQNFENVETYPPVSNTHERPPLTLESQGGSGAVARVYTGTVDPNGVITADTGSLWLRVAGADSGLYVNTSAESGTTWQRLAFA